MAGSGLEAASKNPYRLRGRSRAREADFRLGGSRGESSRKKKNGRLHDPQRGVQAPVH
jgi:hypothetical protein